MTAIISVGFNPSSIGNRPQSPKPLGRRWTGACVSILLLLEIGLKAFHVNSCTLFEGVSILLLLEIGLKDTDAAAGLISRTRVSILLLLEIGLKVLFLIFSHVPNSKFQSFFYWKSASKPKLSITQLVNMVRFNPSSIGNWPQRSNGNLLPDMADSFNPSSIGNRPQRRRACCFCWSSL